MELREAVDAARVPFPATGVYRLNDDPTRVRAPRPDRVGHGRFDDPQRQYAVRYTAETLACCLVETFGYLKDTLDAAYLMNHVDGIKDPLFANDPDIQGASDAAVLSDWLAKRRVAVFDVDPSAKLVNVNDRRLLTALEEQAHQLRDILTDPLNQAAYGDDDGHVHLDGSLIRNPSTVLGRPLTQKIGWLLYEVYGVQGLRYSSRWEEENGNCWALHQRLPVRVRSEEPLSPDNLEHRQAVQYAAAQWQFQLPPEWS